MATNFVPKKLERKRDVGRGFWPGKELPAAAGGAGRGEGNADRSGEGKYLIHIFYEKK